MHRISIITINYNNCNGLSKTIDSVLGQTYPNIEYIIIDGGSIDGSKKQILSRKQAGQFNHLVRFYEISEKDNGIYDAMNKGIKQANGDYCLFLNSGDYFINKNVLSRVFEHKIYTEDIVVGRQIHYSYLGIPRTRHIIQEDIGIPFFLCDTLPHQCSFIRLSLLHKASGYQTNYKIVSDWIFWYEAVSIYKAKIRVINNCIAVQQSGGVSSNVEQREKEIIDYLMTLPYSFTSQDWQLIRNVCHNSTSYKYATQTWIGKWLVKLALYLQNGFD